MQAVTGGIGRDNVTGGSGADTLDGGDGIDTLDFFNFNGSEGIDVNLSTNTVVNDGFGFIDSIFNFENVTTSIRIDTVIGNDDANFFTIIGAGDTIEGGGGNDDFNAQSAGNYDGGDGIDTLNLGLSGYWEFNDAGALTFTQRTSGVTVNLNGSIIDNDNGAIGTISNIERLFGTNFDDALNGTAESNVIFGNGGDDYIQSLSGNDTLNGGDGNDRLDGSFGVDIFTGGAGADIFDNFDLAGAFTGTITDLEVVDVISIANLSAFIMVRAHSA